MFTTTVITTTIFSFQPAGPEDVAHHYVGDAHAPPADALSEPPAPPAQASQGVVYINTEGDNLSGGSWSQDDARQNVSWLVGQYPHLSGWFPAYGAGAKKDAVIQAVREDFKHFNIDIVTARPNAGQYTMAMVGPASIGQGVLGVAPLDCWNSSSRSNVVFAFHGINDWAGVAEVATTISHEVAHSYGLEHVADSSAVMNASSAGGDPVFKDGCSPLSHGNTCGNQHGQHCPAGYQNSFQDLMTLFGPAALDGAAPTVEIVTPEDGQSFEEGSSFEIWLEASDDVGVSEVELYANGNLIGTDSTAPYGWTAGSVPAGEFEFYAVARDAAQNEGVSNVITVYVGDHGGSGDAGDSGDPQDPHDPQCAELPDEDGYFPGRDSGAEAGCSVAGAPGSGPVGILALGLLMLGRIRRKTS